MRGSSYTRRSWRRFMTLKYSYKSLIARAKTKQRDWCPFLRNTLLGGFRCNAKKGYNPHSRKLKNFCLGPWKKYDFCNFYRAEFGFRSFQKSIDRLLGYYDKRGFYISDEKKIKRSLRT